jgi:hypothetical protein
LRPRAHLPPLGVAAFGVILGVLVVARFLDVYPWNAPQWDLHAYWATHSGITYRSSEPGPAGAYLYSPAFAQLISPLTWLPFPLFAALWTALVGAILVWLGGRWAALVAVLPPVLISLVQGQLDLAYAAVAVVGLRWPAAWALPILTKITPGIGVVWFAARREWRSLAIAVAATLLVTAVSFVAAPQPWLDWVGLITHADYPPVGTDLLYVPIPLAPRLLPALALIVWGARTDRRWTIPVAMCLAMPILWLNSPTILVAILPLVVRGDDIPAARWLASRREGVAARA